MPAWTPNSMASSTSWSSGTRNWPARLAVADRLHFHDFVPHDRLAELLVDGNVGMSVYSPISINEAAPAPNKVFENMALGVPVVVGAGNSIADDVLSSGAGRAVEIGSTERLRQAFAELLSDEGRTASKAAREAHLRRYNYEFQLRETILSRVFPSVARVLGA